MRGLLPFKSHAKRPTNQEVEDEIWDGGWGGIEWGQGKSERKQRIFLIGQLLGNQFHTIVYNENLSKFDLVIQEEEIEGGESILTTQNSAKVLRLNPAQYQNESFNNTTQEKMGEQNHLNATKAIDDVDDSTEEIDIMDSTNNHIISNIEMLVLDDENTSPIKDVDNLMVNLYYEYIISFYFISKTKE